MQQIQESDILPNRKFMSEPSTLPFDKGTITYSWIDNNYPVLVITIQDMNGNVLSHEYYSFQ